jgi:cytochrome c oxidase assembly protein subunit 15
MRNSSYLILSVFTTLLALAVIMLGAYVRLSDAGLGCPDWPGCYGQLQAPSTPRDINAANAAYPERPVDPTKAWKEMAHRYLAGTLGLCILALAVMAWRRRHEPGQLLAVPWALVGVVVFQALLGMWTVTLLVKPAVVTAHLLGGLLTVALLWWLTLRQSGWLTTPPSRGLLGLRAWAWAGLGILLMQIALGGWTSTNYAAMGCTEFPTCYGGLWWPTADFQEAFVLWRGVGVDYEFGVLDSAARTAIHLTHRLGALLTLLVLGLLAWQVVRRAATRAQRGLGLALFLVLGLQVGLGIANVVAQLPLPVAVAHNGGAALLVLVLLTLLHQLNPRALKAAEPEAFGKGGAMGEVR